VGWKQRFGPGATVSTRRSDVYPPSRSNGTWFTATRTRAETDGIVTAPALCSVDGEKDVEIKYLAEPRVSASYVRFSSPTSSTSPIAPTSLLRVHAGSGYRADAHEHHVRRLSSLAPQDTTPSIRFEVDEDDDDSELNVGGHLASVARTVEREAPQHAGRASRWHENGMYRP